jgi:outer membrane protein
VAVQRRYFNWKSKVKLNGAGIGQVSVNPWILGVGVGYQF